MNERCPVVKMNTTEMERTQLMTETWKVAAQEVIDMMILARDPDKLKEGKYRLFLIRLPINVP